jgi:hypothetical protein
MLLSAAALGCGGEAPQAEASAAAAVARPDPFDACAVLPGELFAPLVGSPARTSGGINDMGTMGWTSSCIYQNEGVFLLTINAMIRRGGTTAELIDRLGSLGAGIEGAIVPAEGFPPPAAQFYTTEGDLHTVIVLHGDYWVQGAASDLETARKGTRIALDHAP